MATTTITQRTWWDTLHKNGRFPLKWFLSTKLEKKEYLPNAIDRYNDAAKEIQRLLKQALDSGEGFRAIGSKWSMSSIAHQKDRMHFNSYMNIKMAISANEVHANSPYKAENLFFLQCGNQIKEISLYLQEKGKSLKTTGASNGQTIAGCISTGVHGSALDVGSVQDYVVGLNLIIGPNAEDILYLERESKPVLNNLIPKKLRAKIIRNDALFNAALVGLGSFGFIHGVIIEAEDAFLLKRYVRKIPKETALKLSDTLDFKNSDFKIAGEVDANGKPLRPYHYKVFINQYSKEKDYVVEAIYKKPFDPKYKEKYGDPIPFMKEFVYRDLIYLLIRISEKFPKAIPKFVKALSNTILPKEEKPIVGRLSEIFWDAGYQGKAFACSFGVDHKNASKALEVLTKLTRDEGPIPGIFAMRFVKKSEATLAFTKFPITCMIEIDGIQWEKSKKLISLEEYGKRMIEVLQQHNIPFTIHWGKNAAWNFPKLAKHMFPENSEKWTKARSAILSKEMAEVFNNDFLRKLGLDTYHEDDFQHLIASL
ncbi:FAD-binding oxidoreductase [Luteirhabdus pelagi]|uniref:FAD-linked oxidase n=1 Tax=Luteirhabdus pelagi TaxID=2792783 RepID=UPI001939B11C|nr:FAD-linked oxidase [Luteirhabdus pelagi]